MASSSSSQDYYYNLPILSDEGDLQIEEVSSWDEGCHGFEYSRFFFAVIALVGLTFVMYTVLLWKRRRNFVYGFDILYIILFTAATIKFCPTIWSNLSLIGQTGQPSESACKLMAYTTVGILSVIGFVVFSLVMYAWAGTCSSFTSFNALDSSLRRHLGWLVLFLFALEGGVGMAPAIYTEAGNSSTPFPCLISPSLTSRIDEYIAFHTMVSLVLPYIIPFLAMIYPLVCIHRNLHRIEDAIHRAAAKTIVIVASSFIATYAPLSIIALVMYPLLAKGYELQWSSLCGVENFLFFLQDVWYIVIPFVVLLNDPELGHEFPGKSTALNVLDKAKNKMGCQTGSHHSPPSGSIRMQDTIEGGA